ncbi:MAG: hypothetical protein ACFB2W_27690 [Leptolyngbyaceae cyanobacterium]
MDRDRIIEAYIQRLLAWKKPVTPDTAATISKEVGITPAEMHAVKRQAKAHFTRGRSYIKQDSLDDGIHEMTQAMALDPLNLEILHELASAYNQRHTRESDEADKQRALLVAKRCVELKPNDKEAQVLISFLEHTPGATQDKLSQWTRQKITVVAGAFATLGVGILGLSRLPVFSAPPAPLGPAPGTIVPGSVIYESSDSEPTAAPADIEQLSDVDIPVMFDHPGLVLEARLSELGDFEDEVYYQLRGVFINASDQEFRRLKLKVEYLDGGSSAIAATSKEAIGPDDPILRPGDTHAFNLIQKIKPELNRVKLTVTTIEQGTARRTYVPPTPINYSWGSIKPDDISFELASRSETFGGVKQDSPNSANKPEKPRPAYSQSGFDSEWVIINTSDYPINELKLKADFYDSNNQPLQSEDVVAIDTNDAPLLPGESRPFRVVKAVAAGYERYQVTVLEAE